MYQPKEGVSYQSRLEAERYSVGDGRGETSSGRGESRFVFSARAPTREDTQHGYTGDGRAVFSADTRGEFGDRSGRYLWSPMGEQAQLNLGGRDIGYVGDDGAEALAEEGGDEEGAEGEALADLSADNAVPGMRSVRDPTTGEYDIGVGRRGFAPSASGSVEDRGERPPPARTARTTPSVENPRAGRAIPSKPYKASDVPRDKPALVAFITRLEEQHPGYSQAVYATSSAKSVRINTIRKLNEAGLLQ